MLQGASKVSQEEKPWGIQMVRIRVLKPLGVHVYALDVPRHKTRAFPICLTQFGSTSVLVMVWMRGVYEKCPIGSTIRTLSRIWWYCLRDCGAFRRRSLAGGKLWEFVVWFALISSALFTSCALPASCPSCLLPWLPAMMDSPCGTVSPNQLSSFDLTTRYNNKSRIYIKETAINSKKQYQPIKVPCDKI